RDGRYRTHRRGSDQLRWRPGRPAETLMPTVLAGVAGLLGLSVLALLLFRRRAATPIIYGACLAICLGLCASAALSLNQAASQAVLPLGLPWLGAHFRLDALAAAFLVIINFGAASASLYALGYGRHEAEPARVLPFYPAFIAAMNLVVIADDAYGL